jgi:hypothetical protein
MYANAEAASYSAPTAIKMGGVLVVAALIETLCG